MADRGLLPAVGLPEVEIADPRDPSHGDFVCNFALVASKSVGKPPREIAEELRSSVLDGGDSIFESIEVAGPGFLNLRMSPSFISGYVPAVLGAREGFGRTTADSPLKINVEFVSVNPNGPITIGSGRGAAFGSALSSVLEAAGHTVHREYYINDGVNSEQMRLFAESVRAICEGRPVPSNGYKGDYVFEVAQSTLSQRTRLVLDMSRELDAVRESFQQGLSLSKEVKPKVKHLLEQGLIVNDAFGYVVFPEITFSAQWYGRFLDEEPFRKQELMEIERAIRMARRRLSLGVSPTERLASGFLSQLLAETVWIRRKLSQRAELMRSVTDAHRTIRRRQKSIDKLMDKMAAVQDSALTLADLRKLSSLLPTSRIQTIAQEAMLWKQHRDLSAFGVEFDTWFSEQSLHNTGMVEKEIAAVEASGGADTRPIRQKLKLAKGGKIEDVEIEPQAGDVSEEGDTVEAPQGDGETLWLRSTKFGDDMDRVLRRKDGRLTYISSDIAYHKDKFNRPEGADKLITVLGPDHHGYIGRLTAVVAAVELAANKATPEPSSKPLSETDAKIYASPEERDACRAALEKAKKELEVVIFQLVRFTKDGKPAPMRKRDGNIYALIDLIKEIGQHAKPNSPAEEQLVIGRDVARFFYLMRSHDTTFDFDLNLAEKQSDENPVFYVQYAHARICSLIEKAREAGLNPEDQTDRSALLVDPREHALIKKICDLPYEVKRCAEDYGVHRLTTYATELARAYHYFYDGCRVIEMDNVELSQARLSLCLATRVALRATFGLLGISAPERMDREVAPES